MNEQTNRKKTPVAKRNLLPLRNVTTTRHAKRPKPTRAPVPDWQWHHENSLRRALGGYTISQHPYHKPPGLFDVIEYVITCFSPGNKQHGGMMRLDMNKFRISLYNMLATHPRSRLWARPRKGRAKYIFTSAYSQPNPAFDFIDLMALAMNVKHKLMRE